MLPFARACDVHTLVWTGGHFRGTLQSPRGSVSLNTDTVSTGTSRAWQTPTGAAVSDGRCTTLCDFATRFMIDTWPSCAPHRGVVPRIAFLSGPRVVSRNWFSKSLMGSTRSMQHLEGSAAPHWRGPLCASAIFAWTTFSGYCRNASLYTVRRVVCNRAWPIASFARCVYIASRECTPVVSIVPTIEDRVWSQSFSLFAVCKIFKRLLEPQREGRTAQSRVWVRKRAEASVTSTSRLATMIL